jgi:bacillithiol biosynthesis cysteine-adding enzyme BshC
MSLTSRSSTSAARIATLPLPLLYPGDALLRDLAAGLETASRFFTVPPRNSATAVTAAARSRPTEVSLPAAVAQALAAHQRRCDGDECSIANAEALTAGRATCIITGQQAGLLGGPVYTVYKIATAVRLAQQAAERTGRRCVPVFWLASEDHDIGEANHTFGIKPDGEIGRVSFRAPGGRELRRLPVDAEVTRSVARYFDHLLPAGDRRRARCAYALDGQRTFTGWVARSWMRLFAGTGLVIVEPELLRPACGELFERALRARAAAAETLDGVAGELRAAGYRAPLDPATAGTPFEVGPDGTRVRVADAGAMLRQGGVDPAALSTDAALRPLLADLALPSLATVLGPGEVAYQAMLRGLYELFDIAQPLIVGRRSYTLVDAAAAAALGHYDLVPEQIVGPEFSVRAAFSAAVPASERARFEAVRDHLDELWAPLEAHVASVDPHLARTWQRSLGHARLALDRLEDRTARALMSRRGAARQALQALRGMVWPRGRLQERVLPVAHFVSSYGAALPAALLAACDPSEPDHEILIFGPSPGVPSGAAD